VAGMAVVGVDGDGAVASVGVGIGAGDSDSDGIGDLVGDGVAYGDPTHTIPIGIPLAGITPGGIGHRMLITRPRIPTTT